MGAEFFIRYYLSENAHPIEWQIQNILANLQYMSGWQWIPVNKFDYEKSRGYLPGFNDSEIECIKRKSISIIEHDDPNVVVGNSFIYTYGNHSTATLIDDLLTICSIAESKYIYARAVESLLPTENLKIIQRPVAPLSDLQEVVPKLNLESFVNESLNKLRDNSWKEDIGFLTAIHWYRQAQQSFHAAILPLELSLYWIVLEILALTYVKKVGLEAKIPYKKERVKEFIVSQEFKGSSWGFLDIAIDDWYTIRCASFHEGKMPSWTQSKYEQRWRQLAEFVSFVLANLLLKQEDAHTNKIAVRLAGY